VIGLASVAVVLAVVVATTGCAGSQETPAGSDATQPAGLFFDSAPKSLRAKCHATAKAVGYPVPCPTRVPSGLRATGGAGSTRCAIDVIGPGGIGGCHRSWRGWVIGSSELSNQHLVITGSPRPLRNYAKLVNGPAWYPASRVRPLARLTINGWRMRAVYAPRKTNEGSAFADHVVLIWTVGGHTYGIGFHNVEGLRQTLDLGEALARGIELVSA
jgi:hypothetical protein